MTNPVKEKYPRLYAKCLELTGDDAAARVLAVLVVRPLRHEGKGGVILDGEAYRAAPPHPAHEVPRTDQRAVH